MICGTTLKDSLGRPPRILVVDDDKVVLRVLMKILQKAECNVDAVETAHEALERLEAASYDAILIDVHLQDMNGLDLLTRVGTIAPSMKKIVLTGYPSDEDRKKALEQKADYYLTKPVTTEELLGSLDC
ncbi:MAG TPA: response regulator [Candidatus Bathyarchaeia archaeon]|nr:response regulator [Candidatus Bathyarchaeia archaeon]